MNSVDKYLNKIINSDCMDLLRELPDKSIDCIVVDPPYMGVVNEKWDNQWGSKEAYFDWCTDWIGESRRVLKRRVKII